MSVSNGNDQLERLLDAVVASAAGAARAPEPARSWRAGRHRRVVRVAAQSTGALALVGALVAVPALVQRLPETGTGPNRDPAASPSPSPFPPVPPPPPELGWPKGKPAVTLARDAADTDGADNSLYTTTYQGRLCVLPTALPDFTFETLERTGSWPSWSCERDGPPPRRAPGERASEPTIQPYTFDTRSAAQVVEADCGVATEFDPESRDQSGRHRPTGACEFMGIARRAVARINLALLDGRTIEVPPARIRDIPGTDYRYFDLYVGEQVTITTIEAHDSTGRRLGVHVHDLSQGFPVTPLPGVVPDGGGIAFLTFPASLPATDRTRILVTLQDWGAELRSNSDDQAIIGAGSYWDEIKAVLDAEATAGRLRYRTTEATPSPMHTPVPG